MSNFICGQISMPTQWFEMDPTDAMERRTFTLYCDRKTETFSEDSAIKLREFWIRCIQPTYYSPSSPDFIVHRFDIKSNPRRIHPFARAFFDWYESVLLYRKEYLETKTTIQRRLPILIFGSLMFPNECTRNFRKIERDDAQYLQQAHIKKLYIRWEWMKTQDVEAAIIKIQSMFRMKKAIRHADQLRLDPDILFSKETLHCRLSKVGVEKTYHAMLEGLV